MAEEEWGTFAELVSCNITEAYDTITGSWNTMTSLPYASDDLSAIARASLPYASLLFVGKCGRWKNICHTWLRVGYV